MPWRLPLLKKTFWLWTEMPYTLSPESKLGWLSRSVQMNVDVLLINLRESTDRLRFQEQQFARLGVSFKRLDAVQASSIAKDVYADVVCAWQRPISRGELACFLSHRLAWKS